MIDTNSELIVVDVRELSEYCGNSHIPGALNYPWNSGVFSARYTELPIDADILIVCGVGGRSDAASNFLDARGYLYVYDMLGGMASWTYDKVGCVDSDADGINDDLDNCPANANADQADADGDETGDACDTCTDTDGDGFGNPGFPANTCTMDNCPAVASTNQADADTDGTGDICDTCTDTDNDGYGNPGFPANTCPEDNCPDFASSNQNDADVDCIGDVCDPEPDVYDPAVPDIYPPGGNGCGDACECLADCVFNQKVDLNDLVIMKQQFMWKCIEHPSCEADINYDGNVNLADLVMMKAEFGRTDCPACP
jgi:rhodanese-related sulfurtransferase